MSGPLDHPVETLPGIGPTLGARLRERGFFTVADLIALLPREYDDFRSVVPLAAVRDQHVALVEGVVRDVAAIGRPPRRGLRVTIGDTHEGGAELALLWFQIRGGIAERFAVGAHVRVSGKVSMRGRVPMIAHPRIWRRDEAGDLIPVYSAVAGVAPAMLRKAVRAAVDRGSPFIAELVPSLYHDEPSSMLPLNDAYRALHVPDERIDGSSLTSLRSETSSAHRRLGLEELIQWELLRQHRTRTGTRSSATPCASVEARAEAERALPYSLTEAQSRAADEISADLACTEPMRRLLQGDVGTGKTAVALVSLLQAVRAGLQVAFVAPTALLAEQHIATLKPWADRLGIRVELLLGTMKPALKRATLDLIATGNAQVVVGTHALFSESTRFHRLGLTVIDEQHRFGVAQRWTLAGSERATEVNTPHLLVMTATPIPRTVALAMYAGMPVTTIDAAPPGRQPILTRAYPNSERAAVMRQLRRALEAGGQAFVVCPAIESTSELRGAEAVVEELRVELADKTVVCVHGRTAPDERQRIMAAFVRGDVDALVSTTVVEVGVDAPRANFIWVEQAECYGLAQLHQLRGRVGRGGQRAACLLVHDDEVGDDARARLDVLCTESDGFVIAERDLELRGGGDLFGAVQSGVGRLRYASLVRDHDLLRVASEAVRRMLDADPQLTNPMHRAARLLIEEWSHVDAVREDAG